MNTPSLLHAKEDFPVIQPAIVEGVSIYLAEQSREKREEEVTKNAYVIPPLKSIITGLWGETLKLHDLNYFNF